MKFKKAVSDFGAKAKSKLSNPAAKGAPEDQLRAPIEALFADLAAALGQKGSLELIGETAISEISSRPDYAVVRKGALIGHIEIKAPGKGADPRKFKGHDKDQWEKLKRLPNIIYTDGNAFSLWRDGELSGAIVHLDGDIEKSGAKLAAPPKFEGLITDFLAWTPAPFRSTKQLAEVSARLCRLLRDEVTEALEGGDKPLEKLAKQWRELLFPKATNEQFADGYAQAVTFGLLLAKAEGISLSGGIGHAALDLIKSNSLIGEALRLLTDKPETQKLLGTSLNTLVRVLDAVDWPKLTKGDPDAWLYFYENFLEVYDRKLRKSTGSYYTPTEVVEFMVRIVDEALQDPDLFNCGLGLADSNVKIADPAVGGGAFPLGVLRRIAQTIEANSGPGAVAGGVKKAVKRLIGFEVQFGPFAVAQLRILAELKILCGEKAAVPKPRLYITDTLGNPNAEETKLSHMLEEVGKSRQDANKIKKNERIMVVIGNPPYKEKAKRLGGWIEERISGNKSLLQRWMPLPEWDAGAHTKHLYNLYVYFWRWAAWKVFGIDLDEGKDKKKKDEERTGIVCFITAAGFLNGKGFQAMRADLRRECSDIWVIDCSPEGLQPPVKNAVFQSMRQPVCIVMAVRPVNVDVTKPARVRFTALPTGDREDKFKVLAKLKLSGKAWEPVSKDWRASFVPEAKGAWSKFPKIKNLFDYSGSGVMPGRTWVIAPDAESLINRWARLTAEKDYDQKEKLFHPHLLKCEQDDKHAIPGNEEYRLGDKHVRKSAQQYLPQIPAPIISVGNDDGDCVSPVRYPVRSFDRQWIIPDARLINRPNPNLWKYHSGRQIYLTSMEVHTPKSGPACTLCGLIPDLHHYKGRGGHVFPLWRDAKATETNIKPGVLQHVGETHQRKISPEDMMAYMACVLAHPAFISRFQADLRQPKMRLPITADAVLFEKAVSVGAEVIWLHTYGERFYDKKAGRPHQPPRMKGKGPSIPKGGAISEKPEEFPDRMDYNAAAKTLKIGGGRIENVQSAVWGYEVSGMNVLKQWFGYRKLNREKPLVGDRRPPSPLQKIQTEYWLPEYTEDLLDMLHVLGRLVELEPKQKDILEQICNGPLIENAALKKAGAFEVKKGKGPKKKAPKPVSDLLD